MLRDEDLGDFLIDKGKSRHLKALDAHLGLLQDYDPTTKDGAYNLRAMAKTWESDVEAALRSKVGKSLIGVAGTNLPVDGDTNVLGFMEAAWDTYLRADTYHITANMAGFIADVADDLPSDYTIEGTEDMPSPHGVMVLDTPIVVTDVHGVEFQIDVLVWSAGGSGWALYQMTDTYKDPATSEQLNKILRDWKDETGGDKPPYQFARHTMLGSKLHGYDSPLPDTDEYVKKHCRGMSDEQVWAVRSALWVTRFMYASWLVMHGKIGRPRKGYIPKSRKKQVKAAGVDWGSIRVVELRGVEYTGPKREFIGRDVEWSHRWAVRGHFRWHWYPRSEETVCSHCGKEGGIHKRIWIEPFVKGPGDAPYIAKDRVFAVTR